MSQKESEWKKEFEKVMGCIPECASGLYEDVGCPAHGYDAMKAVKFFRGVIATREKEIAEEVEKMKKYHKQFECNGAFNGKGCYESWCEDQECRNAPKEYNQAITDVLQILKH